MMVLRLATANLLRRRSRSLAAVLAAGLACGLVFGATTILQSVERTLETGVRRLGADLLVVPAGYRAEVSRMLIAGEPSDFYMDEAIVQRVAQVEGVEAASAQLFVTSAELECCSSPRVLLVGFDPETDFTISPWTRYVHGASEKGAASVVVGARTLYAAEGTYMTFFGKVFKVVQSMQPTGLGFLDDSIFMTLKDARDMIRVSGERSSRPLPVPASQISSVLVKAGRGADLDTLAEDLTRAVPGVQVIRVPDLAATVRRDVRASIWGIVAAGGASWLMTLLVVGLALSMSVSERRREIGLLRALGATRSQVMRLLLSETLIVTLAGGVLGLLAGALIINRYLYSTSDTLGAVSFLQPSAAAIALLGLLCVVALVVSAAVAAIGPALRSVNLDPYEAIRGGS